eukprot:scaffold124160_cov30-Tisochrysis_lutea.AAC.3
MAFPPNLSVRSGAVEISPGCALPPLVEGRQRAASTMAPARGPSRLSERSSSVRWPLWRRPTDNTAPPRSPMKF